MSRIGKKPIVLPANTEATISDGVVTVKGPLGTLTLPYDQVIEIKLEDGALILTPSNNKIQTRALWGTYGSKLKAIVDGVNKEYVKVLKIEGVGYKAEMKGADTIVLSIGYSHPVPIAVPAGIKCVVEKDTVTISGINKESVGQFTAMLRAHKKPEPYKGKGIRYDGEVIRRKEGKKAL